MVFIGPVLQVFPSLCLPPRHFVQHARVLIEVACNDCMSMKAQHYLIGEFAQKLIGHCLRGAGIWSLGKPIAHPGGDASVINLECSSMNPGSGIQFWVPTLQQGTAWV